MPETEIRFPANSPPARRPGFVEVVIECAVESFVSAFVVWILGGIAVGIAGGFAGDQVPSLPPAFRSEQPLEAGPSHRHPMEWHDFRHAAFILMFSIFFAHSLWAKIHRPERGRVNRIKRIIAKLREHWFGLIVGNAIEAWIGALLLGIAQSFSPTQIIKHVIWAAIVPASQAVATVLLGKAAAAGVHDWFSWYADNQEKLYFWILYLGGAFDDLGVPNFKTLVRWSWRRLSRQKPAALPAPIEPPDPA